MKKIQAATLWMWIFLFTIVPALQSCLDDDNDTPLFTVGTIQTLSQDEGDFYVLLDDNSKLFPGDMSSLRDYHLFITLSQLYLTFASAKTQEL